MAEPHTHSVEEPSYDVLPPRNSAEQPASSSAPVPNQARQILVFVAVLAIIAVGVIGWLTLRPEPSVNLSVPSSTAGGTPSATMENPPTQATSPRSVRFDPIGDLDEPQEVTAFGVWSGVAVLRLEYLVAAADVDQVRTIVCGIDVDTGLTLWTLDALPDGSTFTSDQVMVDGENLAVLLHKTSSLDDWIDTQYPGVAGTAAMVLNLRDGSIVSSHFLEPAVIGTDVSAFTTENLTAYEEGVLVVTRHSPHLFSEGSTYTRTVAYNDTDLSTALWTVTGNVAAGDFTTAWLASDWSLPGGYVKAVDGQYVSIADGEATGMRATTGTTGEATGFFSAGPHIVKATGDAQNQLYTAWTLWDPVTQSSPWTNRYTTTGQSMWHGCVADNTLAIVTVNNAYTSNAYYTLNGVDLTTGVQLWSTRIQGEASTHGCSTLSVGDDTLIIVGVVPQVIVVVVPQASGYAENQLIFDPDTGTQYQATTSMSDVFPCESSRVCASSLDQTPPEVTSSLGPISTTTTLDPISTTITQYDWTAPNLTTVLTLKISPLWTAEEESWNPEQATFSTPSGTIIPCRDDRGYLFVII